MHLFRVSHHEQIALYRMAVITMGQQWPAFICLQCAPHLSSAVLQVLSNCMHCRAAPSCCSTSTSPLPPHTMLSPSASVSRDRVQGVNLKSTLLVATMSMRHGQSKEYESHTNQQW